MRFLTARTIKIGKVLGISIEVDYSWLIVVVLVFWSLAFGFFPVFFNFSTTVSVWLGLGATILFFSSVLLHELAHSVVANRNKIRINKITLFVFGGIANLTKEPTSPRVEARIAAAGPIMSLILGAVFFGLAGWVQTVSFPIAIALEYLSVVNIALALFNLLPGYPLDGGRLFRAALWRKYGLERATEIAAKGGIFMGYLIAVYGVFQFFYLGSLLGMFWFGFIGFFLVSAAKASALQTKIGIALRKVKVRDLMEARPVSVPASLPLRDFVEEVLLKQKQASALICERGKVVAEITLDQVKRLPVKQLGTKVVGQVGRNFHKDEFLKATQSAQDAIAVLAGHPSSKLPVLSGGKLVGAVSRQDVRVYLAVKTDLINKGRELL